MILTVTLNPSIDTSYELEHLIIDDVNRVTPTKTAGGKGINVARVLGQLGDEVIATGFAGGYSGTSFTEMLDADGIKNRFTPIAGETRTCIALLHDGKQTELLEYGPSISGTELEIFMKTYRELAEAASCVVLSGSLPRGLTTDTYAKLIEIANPMQKPVLLDTSGAALDAALEASVRPTLVKPNLTEINALLGTSFTPDEALELGQAVMADSRFSGIAWVVVSMGSAGSVGYHAGQAWRVKTPPIPAVNATGSGDSTIAGFAHAIVAGENDETVLRIANTCGKLNAMDHKTGHLAMDHWDEVYPAVEVTAL